MTYVLLSVLSRCSSFGDCLDSYGGIRPWALCVFVDHTLSQFPRQLHSVCGVRDCSSRSRVCRYTIYVYGAGRLVVVSHGVYVTVSTEVLWHCVSWCQG